MSFSIRFWGVRGSIPCPSPKHMAYGGNTSCVEVLAGEKRVILDAGTGIRDLGKTLLKNDVRRAHLFLSHTHWDHVSGFPFFAPAFDSAHAFTVMGGHLSDRGGIRATLAGQMMQPMFPVPIDIMQSHLVFEDFRAGDSFHIDGGIAVRTAVLNHPSDATAYRIEYGGRAMCYVTDTEHVIGKPDQNVLALIEGADVVIYDSTYTDEEFPEKIGWGHSTWQEAVRLGRRANVKKLVIFHHEPDHEDERMVKIEEEARLAWDRTIVAREGMTMDVG